MNQVETWFGILTRQAIWRGSFHSVGELVAMIETFTRRWNEGSSPFTWVKTPDEILAKAVRKPRATSESGLAMFVIPGIGAVAIAGPIVPALLSALRGAVVVGGVSALGAGLVSLNIPKDKPATTTIRAVDLSTESQ